MRPGRFLPLNGRGFFILARPGMRSPDLGNAGAATGGAFRMSLGAGQQITIDKAIASVEAACG